VTDAGLEALTAIPNLRKVVIHEPKVSESAVARLRDAAPRLEITR
jgi:hypothetical protein